MSRETQWAALGTLTMTGQEAVASAMNAYRKLAATHPEYDGMRGLTPELGPLLEDQVILDCESLERQWDKRARAAAQWTTSSESLPPSGTPCWIWIDREVEYAVAEYYHDAPGPEEIVWCQDDDRFLQHNEVTHWIAIPRPAPPLL